MKFDELIQSITPEIHANLRRAIEIGKWPDGRPLTEEQKALSMQAVIAYEATHLDEKDRVGYVEAKDCASKPSPEANEVIANIRWLDEDDASRSDS